MQTEAVKTSIKFGSLNVCGLKRRVLYPDVVRLVLCV